MLHQSIIVYNQDLNQKRRRGILTEIFFLCWEIFWKDKFLAIFRWNIFERQIWWAFLVKNFWTKKKLPPLKNYPLLKTLLKNNKQNKTESKKKKKNSCCIMLVTVFFTGLGMIYLVLTFIMIIVQFREENERLEKEAKAKRIAMANLDEPSDASP